MGWISNDGLHEGVLDVVLNDGATTGTSNAKGPVVMVYDEGGEYTGQDEQRADDEVIGWRLMCDCSTETSFRRVSTWEGPYWERVPTPALEDVDAGRIYLPPGESASDMMGRGDVEQAALARWQSEHIAPAESLAAIAAARDDITAATTRLNEAVAYARASGKSWAEIGRAAGMSRQSANERWGTAPR